MASQDHADRARDLAEAVLADPDRAGRLAAAGLQPRVEVTRWGKGAGAQAELSISFWRETAFVDVLEDFVLRDGSPTASADELREWIAAGVDEILDADASRSAEAKP